MKNLPRFNSLFFFLFSLLLHTGLHASGALSPGTDVSISRSTDVIVAAPPVCNTPTWPTTSNITNNSATFSWDPVYGAQSYAVQTRTPNGTWYTVPGSPFTTAYATVSWFLPNTTYEWRVRTNCSGGETSAWTYPVTFTTTGWSACNAPDWLSTTGISQTTATFDWEPISGATSYSLQYRLANNGSWITISGGPWTQTWYTITGLQPGTAYEWHVKSNCPNGMSSGWSYSAAFTTLGGMPCSMPTWPVTSNITNTSATFSWEESWGADGYTVQYRLPNGTWYNVAGSPTNNLWITANGLTPNTTYEWRVRANCWGGQYSNWTYPVTFTTTGSSYCYAPDWLYTTNITSTTATFDWDPVSGANSYSLQYRQINGSWWDVPGGPFTSTWYTITGLTPGTTYEWRVRSNCYNWNYSAWSYSVAFTTLGMSCSVPTWPVTSNITNTSATFSWEESWGADGYTVQYRLPNGTWYTVAGSPTNNLWITANGLTPNTTYEWRVRANCWGGQYSNWTYPVTFTTTGSSYCYAPDWLYTTNITSTTATFDWDPVSGANSYSLQYRQINGSWWDVPGGPFTSTWYTITGLTPGTTYEWRVRSNCYNWNYSAWSYSVAFTTLGMSCSVPTWPVTSNITNTSATFSWEESWGADGYTVQYRLPNGTWYTVAGSPTNNTWIIAYGLSPNTTYEWRVRANCWGGQYSDWTYPVTFTTTGTYYCTAPDWLYTTNITSTSATFDWDEVSGANSYSLQYRLANGTWWEVPGGPFTSTWYTINGLTPGTTYEWRVRSNCYNWNYSAWSYSVTFTTLGASCNTPTWPVTSNITNTSATFSWDEVWGAESYTVQTRLPNGTWYTIPNSPTLGTWVTVNGFNPNTTYEWRVRANCWGGSYSNWTYPVVFTTTGSYYCNAPNWLYTSNITLSSATFGWEPVSGAVSYSVQWRLASSGTWYDLAGGPFYNTWVNVQGFQPNTTYEWRVRSNCSNWSYSAWSYSLSFTTIGGSNCSIPYWLSTSNISQSSATLNWSAVWGAWSYAVQIKTSNGTWADVPGSPFTGTSANVTGLTPGTTYQWRIRTTCDDGGQSYWSNPLTFTTMGISSCDAPSWLYTLAITQTSADLDWSEVFGANSYDIQWRTANGDWTDLAGGPWTSTWHTLTGLTPGTSYEWRVRSNCNYGAYSGWSNSASFTTVGMSCGTPGGTVTTEITDTGATFIWSDVAGAVNYTVQIRVPNGTWSEVPGSPYSGTMATVDGLIPGTTYQWRVRANCDFGSYSGWTNMLNFTTSGSPSSGSEECDAATLLTVNSNCVNSASSNIGATESTTPLLGWCPVANHRDVWFTFTMPDVTNPVVTIRTTAGTLTDAVMEVYRGDDCNSLAYIFCEDDNDQGNGSHMPVISISGVPNETIWVRVWGYAGTTGTFSICVFDYQSTNLAVPDDASPTVIDGEILDPSVKGNTFSKDRIVSSTLHIAPNPANDLLQVTYDQTATTMVSRMVLMDMSGKMVFRKDYTSNDNPVFHDQVDVSALAPGIYMIQVVTASGIISEKVSVVD
ncbi:MAG: fibronectin type III domain-containing protein [Saprospiraceae bacterium]|nr:fibronectin type III domain-containing protein [Candidatus Opimibacter iunctus]